MLRSRLHCQKGFNLIIFPYTIRVIMRSWIIRKVQESFEKPGGCASHNLSSGKSFTFSENGLASRFPALMRIR